MLADAMPASLHLPGPTAGVPMAVLSSRSVRSTLRLSLVLGVAAGRDEALERAIALLEGR